MFSKEFYIISGLVIIIACIMLFALPHFEKSPSDIYKRDYIDKGKGLQHNPHAKPEN
jgi:hypothetical protein